MIVDTSALLAIMFDESEADELYRLIFRNQGVSMSAANYLEAGLVSDGRDLAASWLLDSVVDELGIDVEPVTREQARLARDAYRRFGKGNHPARLNFGDCFAYALAQLADEPLLFKGNDFSQTDIARAR